jgi:hypothetical protein
MLDMKITRFILMTFLTTSPTLAQADYRYAPAEGEYALTLPDGPTAETILAEDGKVPYLDNPPPFGAIGEYAVVKRIDPITNEAFDLRVTFLKADREFLQGLTEEKIKQTLARLFKESHIETPKFSFSKGADTLKWGTYSGFSTSQNNDIVYNVAHYLVGASTIMTIKLSYSAQNEKFSEYYKTFSTSISYTGK